MRYGTCIISGIILALTCGIAVYTYIFSSSLPASQAESFEFALLYLGLMAVCSFATLISGFAEATLLQGKGSLPGRQFYSFIAICVFYLLALTYIGQYLLVTSICLAAAMLLLRIRPRVALLVACGFSAVMYGAFSVFLHVPLP